MGDPCPRTRDWGGAILPPTPARCDLRVQHTGPRWRQDPFTPNPAPPQACQLLICGGQTDPEPTQQASPEAQHSQHLPGPRCSENQLLQNNTYSSFLLFFFLLRLYFWNQAPSFLFVLSCPFLFFSIRLFYSFFLFFFFSFLFLWNQPSCFLILWVCILAPFHFLFFWGSGFPPRHFFSGVLQQIKHTSLRFKHSPLQARSSEVD